MEPCLEFHPTRSGRRGAWGCHQHPSPGPGLALPLPPACVGWGVTCPSMPTPLGCAGAAREGMGTRGPCTEAEISSRSGSLAVKTRTPGRATEQIYSLGSGPGLGIQYQQREERAHRGCTEILPGKRPTRRSGAISQEPGSLWFLAAALPHFLSSRQQCLQTCARATARGGGRRTGRATGGKNPPLPLWGKERLQQCPSCPAMDGASLGHRVWGFPLGTRDGDSPGGSQGGGDSTGKRVMEQRTE